VAYRAEIEISVRGTRQLEELRSKINQSAVAADSLNESLGKQGRLAQSLGNYERLLGKAAGTLKDVIAGTEGETKAIKEYVTILGQANEAQTRQNGLIEREIALRNRLKDAGPRTALRAQERQIFVEETISRGRSARIARERSAYLQGPGRTAEAERLAQLAAEESANRQAQFKAREAYAKQIFDIEKSFNKQLVDYEVDNLMRTFKLEESMQTRLFNQALELDKKEGAAFDAELKRRTAAKEAAFEKERRIAEQVAKSSPIGGAANIPGSPAFIQAQARRRQEAANRRREAAGSAIIGGAFPLLFGQGLGAAAGGALGGGLGGAIGGQYGFGLSLVGTQLGTTIDMLVSKASQLGQALNPATANIDAIVASLGQIGTPTAKLINRLEELQGKQAALQEATARLGTVVGDDGVTALKEFGDATLELSNAVTQFVTLLLAEAAKLAKGPVQQFAGGLTALSLRQQATQSTDPRMQELVRRASSTQDIAEQARIFKEIEALQRQINEETNTELENRINALSSTNQLLATEERRLEIARLNGDILNDKVFALEKEELLAQYNIENQKILSQYRSGDLTYQEAKNQFKANELRYERELLGLVKERVDAEARALKEATRARERAAREAERAAKEAVRAQERQIKQLDAALVDALQTEIALIQIRQETLEFERGSLAAVEQRLQTIALERDNELKILDIKYQQAAAEVKSNDEALTLYETYLNQRTVLKEQFELEYDRTRQRKQQLEVERELLQLQTQQATSAVGRDIGRQIEDVQRGLASPFGGEDAERLDLLVSQERRRIDALREVNEQINEQTRLREAAAPGERAEFDIRIQGLQDQLALYERLLPQLDAVEQAQLRQNQLMERYGFLANELSTAMSTAVEAVVTGTGTVEEAFATMFQNIGRAFIDMATQMLAQKLFMTKLGPLGGGSSTGLSIGPGSFDLNSNFFRANGGPVNANQPYIVGERGPELFVPFQRGDVVSNGELRAGGASSAMMFRETGSAQLPFTRSAESISQATQTAQAMQAAGPINVKYESTVINGVEYVTREQAERIGAQSAERGRALTLQALQNSPRTRSKVGI